MSIDFSNSRQKYCIVNLGSYTLGFDVKFVRSVHETSSLTELPVEIPYVLGVLNLRGQVISVYDTHAICNLTKAEAREERFTFLFLECDKGNGALIIDQIDSVIEVESSEKYPPQSNFNPTLRSFVDSVFSYNDDLVLSLDFEKIYELICRG